ncbi:site-specific integrase [Cupriavidus consociatus]|uniref:site-specific integrase n=1 Tax=Cupriavidus consociatus TaxID=2821357 RepID=UPI001AE84A91|nr:MULTISPECIES: site-specific integrase [unclassified Cupriavidus]MBP0625391.1 tyrosine-type recombinase/integrase [Cupriavidus sp. LEh25]MDK2662132.1 site-specific integrase [Cupriavidus sp. LEh21]
MSAPICPQHIALATQLKQLLIDAGYCVNAVNRQSAVARKFLRYIEQRGLAIAAVQPAHVTMYLRCELRRFGRRHGCTPRSLEHWRASHTAGIHQLLRMATGKWPPAPQAGSASEALCQRLCDEYERWLDDVRGLAFDTIHDLVEEARRFMHWYLDRAMSVDDLRRLSIVDIDGYMQARSGSLRRISRKSLAQRLRCFIRFAYATGRISRDFAASVVAPKLYAYESIPSTLSQQQIDAVLRICRADRSPKGLRDHAIALLLVNYGLRAGEIVRLRLGDIDWRGDRLHVRHSKTDSESVMPLLPVVGAALLAYLRRGRPATSAREVFIRARAPYRGFASGSSLYTPLRRRLDAAGVQTNGKRGPHAFRHARAISLLRSGVPPKVIGDVLGHRSSSSVRQYLKLAVDELRDVSLEISELLTEEAQ